MKNEKQLLQQEIDSLVTSMAGAPASNLDRLEEQIKFLEEKKRRL